MSENFNDKDKLTNEPNPERKVWDVEKGEYVDDTREDDDKMFGKESQSGEVRDVEKGEYVDFRRADKRGDLE